MFKKLIIITIILILIATSAYAGFKFSNFKFSNFKGGYSTSTLWTLNDGSTVTRNNGSVATLNQ